MSSSPHDLWALTVGGKQIDPDDLAAAIEWQVARGDLDFRSRLLIRDGLEALGEHWGETCISNWLKNSSARETLQEIQCSNMGSAGFPSLRRRIMESTRAETVRRYLRDLGLNLSRSVRLEIGGAIALILAGKLTRSTEDIDVPDEVPADIRSQHEILDSLFTKYGLHLTHFQSHYLPSGWQGRLRPLGRFGKLDVYLIDSNDLFIGKLFSRREKDIADLAVLVSQFDKTEIEAQLHERAKLLLAEPELAGQAAKNWYILYGEPLPA